MKTANEIIEEKADRIQQHFFSLGAKVSREDFDFVCCIISEAMKQAVEEVKPEKSKIKEIVVRGFGVENPYNRAISDQEEKRKQFFNE